MFDKVVKSTVPGQVIEQIKELLVKGELKRGDRLPPERQLADMLGVSRPSLREALRALVKHIFPSLRFYANGFSVLYLTLFGWL